MSFYEGNRYLFLDLETNPTPDMELRKLLIPDAKITNVPGNYKKPESIQRWFEAKQEEVALRRETGDGLALDVDGAIIRAISYAFGKDDITVLLSDGTAESEKEILEQFLEVFAQERSGTSRSPIVGYNIHGFDIPVLKRALLRHKLGTRTSIPLAFSKYETEKMIDLMLLFYDYGGAPGPKYRGLKPLCNMLGIEDLYEENDPLCDGKAFLDLSLKENLTKSDLKKLNEYAANDIHLVRELFMRGLGIYY